MVSDVTLTPQGQPRIGTTAVPTLRPGDVQGPSLRNVPTVAPTGFQAGQRAYSFIGEQARRTGNEIAQFALEYQAERRKKQAEEEDWRNRELEAQAEQAKIMFETGSLAGVQNFLTGKRSEILEQGSADPEQDAARFEAVLAGATKNLPEPVAEYVQTTQAAAANPMLAHLRAREAQKAAIEAQGEAAQFQDYLEQDAIKYAVPKNDDEVVAQNSAITQYSRLVDARTDLTPSEKQLLKLNLFEGMQQRVGLDYVIESGNPPAAAFSFVMGQTGNPDLDAIPAGERLKVFSQVQGLLGFMQAEQSRASAAQDRARALHKADQIREALLGAEGSPDLAYSIQQQLLNSAQTESEVMQAYSLGEKIKEIHERPYVESDPQRLAALKVAVAAGVFDDTQTAENFIFDNIGKGISGPDGVDLIRQVNEQRESMVSTPEYETIMVEAQSVFPEVFVKGGGSNPLEMLMTGQVSTGAKSPEAERQQQLYNGFVVSFRDKILAGDFSTAAEMQEYGQKQLTRYANHLNTARPQVPNAVRPDVREFDTSRLSPAQADAFSKARSDDAAVTLANEKYRDNPRQIAEDWKSGILSEERARKIQALLMPLKLETE